MTIQDLDARISHAEAAAHTAVGQRDYLRQELGAARSQLAHLRQELEVEQQVQDILNRTSTAAWSTTKTGIERLVTRALRAVFTDREYQFIIEQETKRGVSVVNFLVEEDGLKLDIWEDGGLGVADVVGFALRVAFLALYRPKLAPVIFWDEPFRFVSEQYVVNAARFVKHLATELGIQVVMVTHNPAVVAEADQIFELEKRDGVCQATERTVVG